MEKKPMTVNCREKERTLGRKGERGREGETERDRERQREAKRVESAAGHYCVVKRRKQSGFICHD